MKKLFFLSTLTIMMASNVAFAQMSHTHSPDTVKPQEVIPQRPLILNENQTTAYTGLFTDLSDGNAFDVWEIPLGAGFGLLPNLEIGINTTWLLKPWNRNTVLSQTKLYGRFILIENLIAAEIGIHVPTVFSGNFGLEVNVPVRYEIAGLQFYGQGGLAYFGGTGDSFGLNVAGSVLAPIVDNWYFIGDIGLSIYSVDYGVAGLDRDNSVIIPLGVGVGYQLLKDSVVKASFSFRDLLGEDAMGDWAGFNQRVFFVTFVQNLTVQ